VPHCPFLRPPSQLAPMQHALTPPQPAQRMASPRCGYQAGAILSVRRQRISRTGPRKTPSTCRASMTAYHVAKGRGARTVQSASTSVKTSAASPISSAQLRVCDSDHTTTAAHLQPRSVCGADIICLALWAALESLASLERKLLAHSTILKCQCINVRPVAVRAIRCCERTNATGGGLTYVNRRPEMICKTCALPPKTR